MWKCPNPNNQLSTHLSVSFMQKTVLNETEGSSAESDGQRGADFSLEEEEYRVFKDMLERKPSGIEKFRVRQRFSSSNRMRSPPSPRQSQRWVSAVSAGLYHHLIALRGEL